MATQTVNIGLLVDTDGSTATLDFAYDTATLLISGIVVANNTARSVFARATRSDGSQSYSGTFPPHTTQTIAIGTNQAQRLQLVTTQSGRLDGVLVDWRWA
jgi:hypothetical protein